jgi:hypothetical protein
MNLDQYNRDMVDIYMPGLLDRATKAAETVERMCQWKRGDQAASHKAFHFGNVCPYDAMAAVLRGEPDPRPAGQVVPQQPTCEHNGTHHDDGNCWHAFSEPHYIDASCSGDTTGEHCDWRCTDAPHTHPGQAVPKQPMKPWRPMIHGRDTTGEQQ